MHIPISFKPIDILCTIDLDSFNLAFLNASSLIR